MGRKRRRKISGGLVEGAGGKRSIAVFIIVLTVAAASVPFIYGKYLALLH